jgi:transposase-like protein
MDEEACKKAIFRIRWPQGFSCPGRSGAICGCTRYYLVSCRNLFECARCGRQFSITSGTFMKKSRLPLRKWFEAVALYSAAPDISAAEAGRKLGLTKPTAWLALKKIRLGLQNGEGRILSEIANLVLF